MSVPSCPSPITITARIAQARLRLSPSHQQIADYVLKHPLQAATMPIDELATVVGVSVATANRFARAIGLDGYPVLRADLVKGFEATLAPVEKMRARLAQPGSVHDAFVAVLEESHHNIAATRAELTPAACEAAVRAIAGARRVYVLGWGASGWLAGMLARGLDLHCDHVHLLATVAGTTDGARHLPRMAPDDLLIAISFPRYLRDTVALVQSAHERGVPVLALTDGPHSPLVPLASHCLYGRAESFYGPNCDTAVLALIEALVSALALHQRGTVQSAARMTEAVLPWLHGAGSPSVSVTSK
jgi:DNA-binding MurR/RpiR family transcriptional regulator